MHQKLQSHSDCCIVIAQQRLILPQKAVPHTLLLSTRDVCLPEWGCRVPHNQLPPNRTLLDQGFYFTDV